MKLCESGAALAVSQRRSRWSRSQRILAANLGTKLLARRVQESCSITTSFREQISQHSLAVSIAWVFGRVAGGACIRYMLYERSDPAAGSVNVASRWRTLS